MKIFEKKKTGPKFSLISTIQIFIQVFGGET